MRKTLAVRTEAMIETVGPAQHAGHTSAVGETEIFATYPAEMRVWHAQNCHSGSGEKGKK